MASLCSAGLSPSTVGKDEVSSVKLDEVSSVRVDDLLGRVQKAVQDKQSSTDPFDDEIDYRLLTTLDEVGGFLVKLKELLDHPLGPPARWPFWLEPFHLVSQSRAPSSQGKVIKRSRPFPSSSSSSSFPSSYYGSPSRDPKGHTHKSQSLQDLTSWREPAPRPKPTKTEHEAAVCSFRTALNKLSKSNFEKITSVLLPMKMPTKKAFDEAVSMVFEKALGDRFFQRLYARLACALAKKEEEWCDIVIDEKPDGSFWWALPHEPEEASDKASEEESKTDDFHGPFDSHQVAAEDAHKHIDFRRAILAHCQKAFTDGLDGPSSRTYFSTMTFIGELFVEGMAPLPIMYICLSALRGVKEGDDPSEAQIQAMCELLTTVGATLEPLDSKKRELLPLCLETLQGWSKMKTVSSRLRFGCMDVLDLAQRRWVPKATQAAKKCVV